MSPEDFLNKQGDSKVCGPGHNISSTFNFIPASEIINNLQSTNWLINGYIEQNTMASIFGDPGTCKSFIAIDVACCIATGMKYHGHEVSEGAVFYIAGEGLNGLGRRFKAWQEHNGIVIDPNKLFIAERAAQFCNEEHAKDVAEAIQELIDKNGVKPSLIVIDTLARNFGGDENSIKDMNLFIQNVDKLKDLWDATVLIVHHTGHSDKSRARGASSLFGALDHEYRIQKDATGIISMKTTKTKDGIDPPPLHFEIAIIELSHAGDIQIESAALVKKENQNHTDKKKLSPQKHRAIETLRNCLIDKGQERNIRKDMVQINCVTLEEYQEAMRLENIVESDDPDNIRRSISRIIKQLNNEGITASYDDYIWLPD